MTTEHRLPELILVVSPSARYTIAIVGGLRRKRSPSASSISVSVEEEKALVAFLLLMSSFNQPVRIKYILTLAFSIARRRSPMSRPNKPTDNNWAQAFNKHHPELKAKRVRSIDWKSHEIHIYDKVTEWFEVMARCCRTHCVYSA
jgi:hypothetical protein